MAIPQPDNNTPVGKPPGGGAADPSQEVTGVPFKIYTPPSTPSGINDSPDPGPTMDRPGDRHTLDRSLAGRRVEPHTIDFSREGVPKGDLLQLGSHLYEVIGTLGKGGQGTVLLANDTDLERTVAIKMAHAGQDGSTSDEVNNGLLKEARNLAKVKHDNIVPIYSIEKDTKERLWFIYEYVKGGNLEKRLEGLRNNTAPPIKPIEAATLVSKMASALHAVHECGLCHRDVKPANILINDKNHPYLADFGVAMPLGAGKPMGADQCAGTPSYMSPEQAKAGLGQDVDVDHRCDIFSLGIVLHELLSGGKPFLPKAEGDTPLSILHKVAGLKSVPLPQNGNVKIPTELQRICRKALEIDPNKRYQTAAEMEADLEKFIKSHDKKRTGTLTNLGVGAALTAAALGGYAATRPHSASKPTASPAPLSPSASETKPAVPTISEVTKNYHEALKAFQELALPKNSDGTPVSDDTNPPTIMEKLYREAGLKPLVNGKDKINGKEVPLTLNNLLRYIKDDSLLELLLDISDGRPAEELHAIISSISDLRSSVLMTALDQTPDAVRNQGARQEIYGIAVDIWNKQNDSFKEKWPKTLEDLVGAINHIIPLLEERMYESVKYETIVADYKGDKDKEIEGAVPQFRKIALLKNAKNKAQSTTLLEDLFKKTFRSYPGKWLVITQGESNDRLPLNSNNYLDYIQNHLDYLTKAPTTKELGMFLDGLGLYKKMLSEALEQTPEKKGVKIYGVDAKRMQELTKSDPEFPQKFHDALEALKKAIDNTQPEWDRRLKKFQEEEKLQGASRYKSRGIVSTSLGR